MGLFPQLILLVVMLISCSAHATARFDHYTIEHGLSQNTITSIVEDKYGFIWFASQDGLNRFDGFEFDNFYADTNNNQTLSADYIYDLFIDQQGQLWLATRGGGLNLFDYETERFEHFTFADDNKNNQANDIHQIIQANDEELWLATYEAGIQVFNIRSQTFSPLKQFNQHKDTINAVITSLLLDKDTLWLGTQSQGLMQLNLNNNQLKHYRQNSATLGAISDNQISAIFKDSQEQIWVASAHGLNLYQASSDTFKHFLHNKDDSNSLSHNAIVDIVEDNQHNLWLATSGGINKISHDGKTISRFLHAANNKYSLAGNFINTLFISDNNNLWVGHFTDGISKTSLATPLFKHIDTETYDQQAPSSNNIWAIFEDHRQNTWVGVDGGGLQVYDKNRQLIKRYLHSNTNNNSLSSNRVWAIAQESPGIFWIATFDAGINRLDTHTGTIERYLHQENNSNSLIDNKVVALHIDSNNYLWIGTKAGLDRLDLASREFKHFRHQPQAKNSISYNYVLNIFEDSSGIIWLSTYGGGLNAYNPKNKLFSYYQHQANKPNTITSNKVMAVSEDSSGNLWISTTDGLNKLDKPRKNITRFTKAQGLKNETIYSALEGNDGGIWLTSNRGISRIDKKDYTITNFTLADGLQSYEFNSGAYFSSPHGQLYFGGINGFNYFNPQDYINIQKNLPVTITKVRLSNTPVEIQPKNKQSDKQFTLEKAIYLLDEITLSHKENLISFEFSTLSFQDEASISYQYMLENLDKDWIQTNHKSRIATYTNIPPGNYNLLIRAKQQSAQWGEQVTRLAIEVTPAPWLSWWAYSLYILIFVSLAIIIFWRRYQNFILLKENEERLALSLWGSQRELWDWHIVEKYIIRVNAITNNHNGKEAFTLESLRKTTHPEDVEAVIHAFKYHKDNDSDFLDITYRRQDPKLNWRWYRSRAKAVSRNKQGKAQRIVGTIEDVHQLIEAQQQLQQLNSELEQRVKARTAELTDALAELTNTQEQLLESEKMLSLVGLVTGVAHELNTPLGVVLTALSQFENNQQQLKTLLENKTLSQEALDKYIQANSECMALIASNSQKAARLVKNFKALSHSSEHEPKKLFNVKQLLEFAYQECQLQTQHNTISLQLTCSQHIVFNSYQETLKSIFKQLIENSCLHAFEESTKQTLTITIEVTEQDNALIFDYKDDGQGLKDEVADSVFEPFVTTKRGSDCVGLGMPILYNQIVHSFKGSVQLVSNAAAGFHLIISLPKDSSN